MTKERILVFQMNLALQKYMKLKKDGICERGIEKMANRRCISNSVIETDDFLKLSKDARLLYFMLNMNADDLGFIGKPKAIARENECDTECLDELEKAGFIKCFHSGVVWISNWLIHNTLKNDRTPTTRWKEEMKIVYPNGFKNRNGYIRTELEKTERLGN